MFQLSQFEFMIISSNVIHELFMLVTGSVLVSHANLDSTFGVVGQ